MRYKRIKRLSNVVPPIRECVATAAEEKGLVGPVPVLVPEAALTPAERCAKPSGQALGRLKIFNRKRNPEQLPVE